MTGLNRLSQNPIKQEEYSEKENIGRLIRSETKKAITIEEFEHMSVEDMLKNSEINSEGKIVIFGKDVDYWINNVSDQKIDDIDEVLEKSDFINSFQKKVKQINLLDDIISIWNQEAYKQSAVWFKFVRNDHINIGKSINSLNKAIQNFTFPVSEELFNNQVNQIFGFIELAESEKSIIGKDDIKTIKDIFVDNNIPLEKKQIQIFNLMRYGGWSGNSEGVKSVITNLLLDTEEFSEISKKLEDPNIREYIFKRNAGELESLFGKPLADKLLEIDFKAKQSITIKLHRDLDKINKEREDKGEGRIKFKDYYGPAKEEIENARFVSTIDAFKKIMVYTKIEGEEDRGNEKESLKGMYANLSGLGQTSLGDSVTIADENIDLAVDFATTIAIGVITVGMGGVAIGGTRLLGSMALRGALSSTKVVNAGTNIAEGLRIAKYLKEGTKARTIGEFAWKSTYEGIAFYEGATLTQNLMFRDLKDWNEGLRNEKEFVKNIAFMGALNSLKYLSQLPGMSKIMNFDMKIPDEYLKPGNLKKVLEGTGSFTVNSVRDGSIMFGISGLTEKLVGEEWHPTVKEYLEFIVLIQVLHIKDMGKKSKNTGQEH